MTTTMTSEQIEAEINKMNILLKLHDLPYIAVHGATTDYTGAKYLSRIMSFRLFRRLDDRRIVHYWPKFYWGDLMLGEPCTFEALQARVDSLLAIEAKL